MVTDYPHTAWWTTFKLADVAIFTGVLMLVVASWRHGPGAPAAPAGS